MRDLVYYVAVSIDGCIADANGGYDAFLTEGDHNAVIFGEYADALPGHVQRAVGIQSANTTFDTVVMGWNTLIPALDAGITSPYPHLRQVVASRRERDVDPSVSLTNDPVATVRSLKSEAGADIWLCGGGELAGALLPEIDRLVLKRHPVALGSGIRLFSEAAPAEYPFTRTRVREFASGVAIEEYVRRAR